MLQSMSQQNEDQETAERALWRAVIVSTVQEWMGGQLRRRREAEKFLFQDEKDYKTVCCSAGIDPQNLRERLQKIRERIGAMGTVRVLPSQTVSRA
jgi:hypothetical protein